MEGGGGGRKGNKPGTKKGFATTANRQRRNGVARLPISRAMLAINATLIYHALTYDVDGSRTSQDKTNRRNWRWQAVSCRCRAPLVFAARYFARGTNKTWLINKCINIATGQQFVSSHAIRRDRRLDVSFSSIPNEGCRFLGLPLGKRREWKWEMKVKREKRQS